MTPFLPVRLMAFLLDTSILARALANPRKRRTREHVSADLSVHHVEGPILRVGFTAQRIVHDYGLDLVMTTYNAHGEPEEDYVWFQLKATDHLKRTADGSAIICRIERVDLIGWLRRDFSGHPGGLRGATGCCLLASRAGAPTLGRKVTSERARQ